MKFHQLILVLNIAFPTEVVAQAVLEKNDHLTCYRIKDSLKLEDVAVDMIANRVQEEFTVRNCRLKQKKGAFRMCIPSTKNVLTEGVADPTLGGLVKAYDPNRCLQNDFLCYQVSCDTKTLKLPKRKVIDQFNMKGETRTVKFMKQKIEICTPAWKLTNKKELVVIECPSPTPAPSVASSVSPTECVDDPDYRFYVFCQEGSPFCQEFGCADILTFPGLRDRACNNEQTALACCISCNASEAPTASPVKQFDKCEWKKNQYPNLFNVSFLPFKPTSNNIISTITQPPYDYRLTFGLTAHSLQTATYQSVIHFTTGNNQAPPYGARVPGVWLRNSGLGLQLLVDWDGASPLNYLTSPALELDKEYCFTITCKDVKKSSQFQIIMDGITVAQGISTVNRLSLFSVKVYAGDPWYVPADATISDLYYSKF
mmetsp:Transcript_7397/g.15329  ORF Transcript_7397/g.15329 Transcript_7397/m.15329 type:complete len:427 (+) Transcript_7397:153-1433(+)